MLREDLERLQQLADGATVTGCYNGPRLGESDQRRRTTGTNRTTRRR